MPIRRIMSPKMPYKRFIMYAVICATMVSLMVISYQHDLIRGVFGIATGERPQVNVVGQDISPGISGHALDHRDIRIFMQNRQENEAKDKIIHQGVISPVRVAVQNDTSPDDVKQQSLEDSHIVIRRDHPRPHCVKQVHIWGNEDKPQGIEPCPGLPCGINLVIDTSYHTLKTSHAVLLLHRTQWDWSELMNHRPEGQKWIFYSQESPLNTKETIIPPTKYYSDAYDYIMSYRFRESHLYGRFGFYDTSKPSVSLNDTRNWASGRTRQVAWLASNCNSTWLHWNRTEFVQELSKLLDVGMYGRCGDQEACPYAKDSQACSGVLRQFKFYLALENCACRDYITEKLWKNAYLQDLVPIVFGPPRSDYEAVVPPNSFIHVQDFETLQDLADFVNLLDKNDHLYNNYFEWKKLGFVTMTNEAWLLEPEQMCQVVNRLLSDQNEVRAGTFQSPALPDWTTWWTNSCLDIPEFPIKMQR